ncbi:cytosine methyltransferase [Mycolicibacterium acapulense]|nr:cytosine methyltransferase [Mycolicibacterium acapulense]
MTPTCVSLFSGAGGLDLGVQRAGFEIVFATDSDARCAESHKANFDGTNFVHLPVEALTEEHFSSIGRPVDLLVGGPPCPPFSKSRFYRTDKPRALRDPVADATISGYLKVLRVVRPRVFMLENVPGLRYKVHAEALKFIEDQVHALGYTTNWAVLNAADYGVPQIRFRFVMIGSLTGRVEMPTPTHAKAPASDPLNAQRLPWRTAGDVLTDLDTEENADDKDHFAGGQYHDLLRQIPPGDNYLYFTAKRGHPSPVFEWRKRYWSFLLKLSPDLPSWTIQARRSNNMGPFHWRNRILRIEEVKRLQTFPDEWYLAGRVEEQWRQIGNAVPPLLAEALGRTVLDHL